MIFKMIDNLIYISKNSPDLINVSWTNNEIIGKFKNNKTYSIPIIEYNLAILELNRLYTENLKIKE